jgi:hypothetical protein
MKKYIIKGVTVYKSIFVVFFAISCFLSCSFSKSDDVDRAQIADVLKRIEQSFNNWDHVNNIMSHYHPDFLHNGATHNAEEFVWRERKINFIQMQIEVISIEIYDHDFALARLRVYYFDRDHRYGPFIEPEHFGDMSYFFHDQVRWWIYGNRELIEHE